MAEGDVVISADVARRVLAIVDERRESAVSVICMTSPGMTSALGVQGRIWREATEVGDAIRAACGAASVSVPPFSSEADHG